MKEIIEEVVKYMNSIGYKREDDYDLRFSSVNQEWYLDCVMPLKGNSKVISKLENLGWVNRKRYRNDTGELDIWTGSDFGYNYEYRKLMVVMSRSIGNDKKIVKESIGLIK